MLTIDYGALSSGDSFFRDSTGRPFVTYQYRGKQRTVPVWDASYMDVLTNRHWDTTGESLSPADIDDLRKQATARGYAEPLPNEVALVGYPHALHYLWRLGSEVGARKGGSNDIVCPTARMALVVAEVLNITLPEITVAGEVHFAILDDQLRVWTSGANSGGGWCSGQRCAYRNYSYRQVEGLRIPTFSALESRVGRTAATSHTEQICG